MLKQLEAHLKLLSDTGADKSAIDNAKAMIKKEKARLKNIESVAEAELEQMRTEQLEGINRHLKELNNAQQGFNLTRKELLEKRNQIEDAAGRELINKQLIELEELEKINKLRIESAEAINRKFEDFGFVTDFKKSKSGRFLSDMEGAFTGLAATMASAIQPANLFAAGMDQMIAATSELFKKFDSAQANLSKVTATTGEYNDMLYDVQESNKSYNVSVEEVGKAIGDLHNQLSSFNQMSRDQQTALVETTARMEALGVSTADGAKQFDNMIQGMGMTATMANDATMELVSLGDNIGVAADVISKDFNAAAGELAKYGTDAINVFKGMSAAAKATGIEMSTLMSVTSQYDTFRGAAEGAGKLNAILGGGVINSMDLLNATEEERVRLLIQSMQLSGKNFESLNRFEKQAIANAAGISDMTEANKLFSMSLSAYDDMQAKAGEASAEAAKLQERAQAATELGQKMKQIGQAFAVGFMPVLEFMHGFANIILDINDMTGGMFIPVMVGLVGVIALLSKTTAIHNAIMQVGLGIRAASALVTGGLSAAQGVLASTTAAEGTAAAAAAPANAALAGSFAAMLPAILPLTPAIAGLGFAIGGLGLAIAAPFIALAAIVIAFKELFLAMLEAPKAIGAAVTGLLSFAAAGATAMVIMAYGLAAAAMILLPFTLVMLIVAPALLMFSFALLVAGAAMYLAGAGLKAFGEGLATFNEVEPESLVKTVIALGLFSLGLIKIMPLLAPAMLLVGVGLLLFGAGLKTFAKGIAEFNKVGVEEMFMAVASLLLFSALMIEAALPIGAVALLLGIPLMMIGAGLKSFAKGLAEFNKVGIEEVLLAAGSLVLFGIILTKASFFMGIAALALAVPLMLISVGLEMFADSLKAFKGVKIESIIMAADSLVIVGSALTLLAPVAFFLPLIAAGLIAVGPALGIFADGVSKFSAVGVDALAGALISIAALTLFGGLMSFLVKSGIIFEMVFGFVLLSFALTTFGNSLIIVGAGLAVIAESMQMFTNLTETLSIISQIGGMGAAVMGVLAVAIMGIALAMMLIPESKTMSFGFAMQGYAGALAAVAALTPDTTELAERVVAAAGEYAEIQAEMKMPDQDSFVQAMKNVFGMGDKEDKGGQDIILQVNGREFARAVDVAIKKKHNLRID